MTTRILSLSAALVLVCTAGTALGYKADIGHTQLANELGGTLPTGTNITISQIETPIGGNYMPDSTNTEFSGKSFNNISGSSNGISTHATDVGRYFYGTITSIAPDINTIDNYEVVDWLGAGFLHSGDTNEPAVEARRIQNHSWVSTNHSLATNIIRSLDYAIDRDGFTAVVGLMNTTLSSIPLLMPHTYNGISVGRSDGLHSTGYTSFDEAGRTKPEIVVPLGSTSASAPVVGAAAALLMETTDGNPALTNANRPECVKAILLAGATKDEFPSWSRTPDRPLDETYGAGELNIYNSYYVLTAGEQEAGTTSLVQNLGWDFQSISGGANALYFFQVPESNVMTRFSAILTWHREITNGPLPWFDPVPSPLADLDLHLYEATNFTLGNLIDSSTSTLDNVEHIYRRNMPSGRYAFEISAAASSDCAVAWFSRTALIPKLQSITMTNGNVRFESSVSSGIPYGIESSTNLLETNSWIRIDTNTSSTNVLVYVDTDSTNFTRRFYRLVIDP